MIRYIIFCATILLFSTGIISQESSSTSNGPTESTTITQYVTEVFDGYNPNNSHCFRFTWLGPGYDNSSKVNGSCNDLAEKYKMKNTPCKQPLVITDNTHPPNMTDLFMNYRDFVTCRRSEQQVCIKYTYRFNGELDNITYMCGKVRTEGEGAETSGCFIEYNSGYETEVCACKPKTDNDLNNVMPCNSAAAHKVSVVALLALFTCFLFQARLTRWQMTS